MKPVICVRQMKPATTKEHRQNNKARPVVALLRVHVVDGEHVLHVESLPHGRLLHARFTTMLDTSHACTNDA